MSRQLAGPPGETNPAMAHDVLAALADAIGSGLAAAGRQPRLLALLDQHTAAVRDSLRADVRPPSAVALARYAHGVRDAAREHGWLPPDGPVDWASPDWVLTRLLAVHALARRGWPALR
ncbi:MAG TPA: DUF6401 family natural product biosynthesis protein [Micromonosporaceae bacterium]